MGLPRPLGLLGSSSSDEEQTESEEESSSSVPAGGWNRVGGSVEGSGAPPPEVLALSSAIPAGGFCRVEGWGGRSTGGYRPLKVAQNPAGVRQGLAIKGLGDLEAVGHVLDYGFPLRTFIKHLLRLEK